MASQTKKVLIGTHVRVSDAKNRSLLGLYGTIVDETKNTLLIKTSKGVKRVLKDGVTLEFAHERIRLKGDHLLGRPEERIKKKLR
ncbi:ribonuclease P protein subunit [Candidatus Woesearchaeota archaeon]|nr:ribonuclease P protein subunit [Candidatus Woesearchaeota archaeon]